METMKALILAGLAGVLLAAAPSAADDPDTMTRAVVNDLAARQFDNVAERFNARMAAALSKEQLATTWDQLVGQVGAFKAITSTRVATVGALQRVEATCAFEKTPLLVTIVLDDQGKIAGLNIAPAPSAAAAGWTPPAYANTALFDERDVTIGTSVKLPGTLSMPRGPGPFPAVVLVHGSGPNDRDETIAANKPFKDLAVGLASRGVAVLRYDKRTFNYRGGGIATVKEEVLDDAREAVSALEAMPGIDPKRIVVLGHSLGGTLAPRIAAADARVAGLVILAGATRSMEDAALDQLRYLGADAKTIAAVEASARTIKDPNLTADTSVDFLGARIPGSYWLDLRQYDPAEAAASLTIPILLLQGERDYQVTMTDYNAWSAALAGRANVTRKTYPSLNHLFLTGTGPSKPEEYAVAGHVADEVIRDIAGWMLAVR
jgi:uncharacterized protein